MPLSLIFSYRSEIFLLLSLLSHSPLCIPQRAMLPENAPWFSFLITLHVFLDEVHSHPGLQLPVHADDSGLCLCLSPCEGPVGTSSVAGPQPGSRSVFPHLLLVQCSYPLAGTSATSAFFSLFLSSILPLSPSAGGLTSSTAGIHPFLFYSYLLHR